MPGRELYKKFIEGIKKLDNIKEEINQNFVPLSLQYAPENSGEINKKLGNMTKM